LATAGAFLLQSSFTFERYLQEYEKHWNIYPRRPLRLQEYQDRTLYTTWDLSYLRLEKEGPDAAKLLQLFAYFDNQSIWYELLHGGLGDDSPEWLPEVVTDEVDFDGVMTTLTDYCFLEVQTATRSWSMHNCVHDWALAALNKVIDAQQYWYTFDCVSAYIDGVDWDSLGHLSHGRVAAHAARLVRHQFRLMNGISPSRLAQGTNIAQLLQQQIRLTEAEEMYRRALAGYEKALGPDHTSTLDTVNKSGNLYAIQGKLGEAEKMYRRALAGYEKAPGADYTSTLDTANNLGILYANQGKLGEAEKMYRRALAGKEKTLGPDHTLTLGTVGNLGNLYRDQGKLGEAEKMYRRALAGKEKVLKVDHTSTLGTVHNLGNLYYDQGKLGAAEEMYQRALAGYEKALGPEHTSTLATVSNLGSLYANQGKLGEAEKMYRRALAGYEKALGPDHTSTLKTVYNLGLLYAKLR
jgi:tetratricopeptide (TPR) repeat protein